MLLKESVHSVLIISSSENFIASFKEMLPVSGYSPVKSAVSASQARRIIAEETFDYIVINSPLTDDPGIRLSVDVCESCSSVVLLAVSTEFYDEIYCRVADFGVYTIPKPVSRALIKAALDWMHASYCRAKKDRVKVMTFEEKMKEIRLVNRAKWVLISELNMNEQEAHRFIEKEAMDRCVSKKSVAESIINTYST
ncbi:MAG: ANTAR domain-containing protein [Clostridia bacterium]|nr:ANTAR domain-containing protein [Clostridia bacterium]